MYKKKKILDITSVYTANAFQNDSGFYIGAGSEAAEGEVYLYNLSNCDSSPIPRQPGGMMSFIPVPGKRDLFISVMGLLPNFNGEDAGVYLHTRMETNWESGKALGLPFAHRCETFSKDGKHYLIAVSVSQYKNSPEDWSRPGEMYVVDLENCEYKKWIPELIDKSIRKNHGMCKTTINDLEVVCVCGTEGIYYIDRVGEEWRINPVLQKEVSEMAFFDLDGDGENELVTVEPFHGNTLNIYKKDGANWVQKFSDGLSLGHGLSAGIFKSEPTIVVGNRAGSMALEAFIVRDLLRGTVERKLIEEGVAPTQTQVFTYDSKDYILSANQKKNEVALYT